MGKLLSLHIFNLIVQYMEQSFIAFIEQSIKDNWDLDALTDYKGATLQYKDLARKIEKLHIIFEASGIQKGDKIAVCGRNSSHWGVTFLATLTYGGLRGTVATNQKTYKRTHYDPKGRFAYFFQHTINFVGC